MKNKITLFILSFLFFQDMLSVSLVYNMKIRRAVSLGAILQSEQRVFWLLTALPIFYERSRHIVAPTLHQNIYTKDKTAGAIFNIRGITSDHWWLEFTTGLENQKTVSCGTATFKTSRTGFDDIVLSAGKNFFLNDNAQCVVYGICGFPTKTSVNLLEAQGPLVGSRFFGLGAGAEFSYSFIKKLQRSLLAVAQARFVHFFNRKWFPILPCTAQIEPGNITDLFIIMQYRERKDVFEVGYNPTFFTNQGVRFQASHVASPNFVRNSFYANYLHLFMKSWIFKRPGAVGAGFNIGRADIFDTKIAACWFNVSLLF
jgi:hypothetical protein